MFSEATHSGVSKGVNREAPASLHRRSMTVGELRRQRLVDSVRQGVRLEWSRTRIEGCHPGERRSSSAKLVMSIGRSWVGSSKGS